MRMALRPGLTLVELIAAIAILGLMAGIAGVAYRGAEPVSAPDEFTAAVSAARREAVRLRTPVTISIRADGQLRDATALPDGSVVIDAAGAIRVLEGRPGDAR